MERSFGVRKGAWTEEEDILLKQCVETYGEGKWFQIPYRAGLNRCRKSCRMRWLNYLKPNIKRGDFAVDEVDLIMRLHKLLGNRWSLIAGRLPGRTANDVKNFWNSLLKKKETSILALEAQKKKAQDIVKVKVIKPQPRPLSKKFTWLSGKPTTPKSFVPEDNMSNISPALMSSESRINWWEYLLDDKEDDKRATCSVSGLDKEPNKDLGTEIIAPEARVWNIFDEDDPSCLADFSFEKSLWDFLNAE